MTDNVYDLSLPQLLQKQMFRELITILGCGVGKDFDINKLRYDKIVICTDADSDGMNITSLLLCFFYVFMPEIITSGKLYKALPPLYIMELKSLRKHYTGREWLYDKNEYYDMVNTIISSNIELALDITPEGKRKPEVVPLNKKQTLEWLRMNSEYSLELDNLGKKSATNTSILENVCYYKSVSKDTVDLANNLERIYPEMNYDIRTNALVGAWNGEHFSLICDELFDRSARRFNEELMRNKTPYIWFKSKDMKKFEKTTIGDFFNHTSNLFNINIEQRFKGLGEAETDLLFRTTTNPKYRKLYKINISDVEKTDEIFELLHGKSAKLRESRRELLDNTKLSYADIDN